MADTTTILNRLISALTSQDPTWDVVPGTAEYKILEAVAQELAIAANNNTLQNYSFDITTKSGSQLDDFCALFGIFRSQGKRASGNATFSTASTGLIGGTLTIQNATGGTFSASYNGSTASSLAYNISAGTLQTQLSSILPVGTVVNVTYSSPTYTISISPALPAGMLTFDTSGVTGVSGTLNTSWSPSGGATANYEIPLGTQIYAPSAATGTVPIYYQTTASSALPQYGTQVQVPIQAVLTGSNGNLTAGTISALATALAGVTQVTNSTLTGGSDAETDDQLRQRWQNTVFKNLSGTEDQFRALALSNPGTSRVKVLGPQEQNTEDLQIQTSFNISSKLKGALVSSTTINSADTFNLYFQVDVAATWTVVGSGTSSVVTFTIPSSYDASGIKYEMNVYSFTYPIAIIYGLTVQQIVINSDGSTTITAFQTNGSNQTITGTTILTPVSFCVPVSPLTTGFSGATTLSTLQTQLNNVVSGSIITDLAQTIALTPKYNSGTLTVAATGGIYYASFIDDNGVTYSSTSIAYNANPTTSIQAKLNTLMASSNYQCVVNEIVITNPYTYVIDFFTLDTNTPVDVSIINQRLSFNFASLTGGSGTFVVPSGTNGTVSQLYSCNVQFAKANTTDLVVIAGRIDSGASAPFPPTNIITDSASVVSDYQSSPANYTYVYGSNIAINTVVISGSTYGTNLKITSPGATASLGGVGIQLVFTGSNNNYSITNSITTSLLDAIYIYPQGIESLQSNSSSSSTQQIASPIVDYTYLPSSTLPASITTTSSSGASAPYIWTYVANNNFSAGQTVTISGCSTSNYNGTYVVNSATSSQFTVLANASYGSSANGTALGSEYASLSLIILNGNKYSWLYPGNIPTLTYYMILDASRNVPTISGISTNYVDVIVDGDTQQLITEDIVMNTANTTVLLPGCSGTITTTNATNWVLGDKITNPPAGDLFYIFSQQPVIQPWFGIYPQKLTLSQAGGLHTALQAYSGPIGGNDPTIANITLGTTSSAATAGTRSMKAVYYQEWIYVPEAFASSPIGIAKINNYSQTGNSITLNRSDGTAGTYPNVILTSDVYPIYDNTINQGSTSAINGIGIRQTVAGRTDSSGVLMSNGNFNVSDDSVQITDLGQKVTGTNIPPNTRITSITIPQYAGSSFTMSNAATGTGSGSVTISKFCNTPTISTGDLIFGLQYYVDNDVVAIDNLIQQQRLVGISTMTHLAKSNYFLINLVAVLSSSTNISSVNTSLNTQISNYMNSLPFGEPIQASTIVKIALSTSGVINARIANPSDNGGYYGMQEVTPYTYYTSIQEITQGGASTVDFRDILIKQTYSGDIPLGADDVPILFRVNLYTRSQSDF